LRNILNRRTAFGIHGDGTSGVVIDSVAITNCNNPIELLNSTGLKISNCSLMQVRGDAAISLGVSSGGWDANIVCSNSIELLINGATPPGGSGYYNGPDGISCTSGVTVYGNKVKATMSNLYTSNQHSDMIQATGNYLKVFGNEFVNAGDSAFDYDCFANPTPHDIWIYNNIYRIVTRIDPYPEFFRMYISTSTAIQSINNVKILNNLYVDNADYGYPVIRFDTFNGNPTASGNEIKNNIFMNCGSTTSALINIAGSSGFTTTSWSFEANTYYLASGSIMNVYNGNSYSAANWISAFEPHGKIGAPQFVSYSAGNDSNNYHLQSSDTFAQNSGLNLSTFFTTDRDGNSRPTSGAWDIGPCQHSALAGPVISVSPTGVIFGVLAPGQHATNSFVVSNVGAGTLSGSATVAPPFRIVGDGTYSGLANGQSTVVQVAYDPASINDTGTVNFAGGGGTTASVSGGLLYVQPGLSFSAAAGTINSPFAVSGNYVSQDLTTADPTQGGQASYWVSIPSAGNYVVQVNVNAPNSGQKSCFVSFDVQPVSPDNIWDVTSPYTVGFENRTVSWRGSAGTFDNDQYQP
jgi:hypothetical protein